MLSVRQWIERRSGAQAHPEPLETRQDGSGYTDALLSLLVANAQGNAAKADINTSGALEVAAGVIGRAFASARVETPRGSVPFGCPHAFNACPYRALTDSRW